MKLSKVLLSSAVAAALVFGFAGCKTDEDDPNNMIAGSGKNYSIAYTNEDSKISRGYVPTSFAHAGAAVQIDFTDLTTDTAKSGVMGLIFDLDSDKDGKRSFDVIGVRASDNKGGVEYYISRFTGVTDIQDENFGAYEGGPATEIEYVPAFKSTKGLNSDGKTTVYAYAIQKKVTEDGKDSKGLAYKANEFVYKVYLLTNKIAKLDSQGNLINDNGQAVVLDDSDCLATIATGYKSLTQKKLSVYANVYPTAANKAENVKSSGCGTLTGKWTFRGDYKEVGIDEN